MPLTSPSSPTGARRIYSGRGRFTWPILTMSTSSSTHSGKPSVSMRSSRWTAWPLCRSSGGDGRDVGCFWLGRERAGRAVEDEVAVGGRPLDRVHERGGLDVLVERHDSRGERGTHG